MRVIKIVLAGGNLQRAMHEIQEAAQRIRDGLYGKLIGASLNGFGGEISSLISENFFEYLDAPVLRIASKDIPVAYSSILEDEILVQTSWIEEAINKIMNY